MNKAIIAACMGLLVVAGCSKDKKPAAATDPGMTPPPPPSVITPAPEPITMAPAPADPIVTPTPAPEPTRVKAAAPRTTPVAKPQSTAGKKVYVVKKGDSLSEIAQRNKTTVAKIMKANPKIKSSDKIIVGQKITLP